MVIRFHNYQYISVAYIDGKFYSADLHISIDRDGENIVEHMVKLRDYGDAMKALRRIEKLAGEAAKMSTYTSYSNTHHKYRFSPATSTTDVFFKTLTYSKCEFD